MVYLVKGIHAGADFVFRQRVALYLGRRVDALDEVDHVEGLGDVGRERDASDVITFGQRFAKTHEVHGDEPLEVEGEADPRVRLRV
jgi:hypothetical protein